MTLADRLARAAKRATPLPWFASKAYDPDTGRTTRAIYHLENHPGPVPCEDIDCQTPHSYREVVEDGIPIGVADRALIVLLANHRAQIIAALRLAEAVDSYSILRDEFTPSGALWEATRRIDAALAAYRASAPKEGA